MPPWNRWSFQHVADFLETAPVPGPERALALPVEPIALEATPLSLPDLGRVDLAALLEETYCDGCLVWHDGRVIFERYFNGMTGSTLHLSQSMAKSVTAAAAGVLVGEGKLDPASMLVDYLPSLADTGYADATLRHVLDMTSGVKYVEDYEAQDSDVYVTDVAAGWRPPREGTAALNTIRDQILTLRERTAAHGVRWLYRSIETDVLAHCMEAAAGEKLTSLVSRLVWQPMGAGQAANFTVDADGYGLACGGLNATLRDYARFGLLYLNSGRNLAGEQVIPADWVADTRVGNHEHFAVTGSAGLPDGAYRNQFWIEDSVNRAIMCVGIFGQLIYLQPDRDFMFVKLSTWPTSLNPSFKVDTLAAIHQLMDHLDAN